MKKEVDMEFRRHREVWVDLQGLKGVIIIKICCMYVHILKELIKIMYSRKKDVPLPEFSCHCQVQT